MRFGVIGINYKLANMKQRDLLAKACHKHFGMGCADHFDFSFILLSTCNRTEVYFSSDSLSDTHSLLISLLRSEIEEEFEQKLYSFFGDECFHHLCRVTAGLDSAEFFETEIQGQVKSTYTQTISRQKLPSELHFLFQKALKVGKQIRSRHRLPKGLPNLEKIIYSLGSEHIEREPKILVVGASAINTKLIAYLKKKPHKQLAICNRTEKRARHFAEKFEIDLLPWEKYRVWHAFDWIIFGTSAPDPILKKSQLPEAISRKVIMDLSVPRNVEAAVGEQHALYNIDQLQDFLRIQRNKIFDNIHNVESFLEKQAESQLQIEKSSTFISSRQEAI